MHQTIKQSIHAIAIIEYQHMSAGDHISTNDVASFQFIGYQYTNVQSKEMTLYHFWLIVSWYTWMHEMILYHFHASFYYYFSYYACTKKWIKYTCNRYSLNINT